jgi:two-component system NarL family sensor kinase
MTGGPAGRLGLERADRVLALIRLAALPIAFAGERLVPHVASYEELFVPLLGAAAGYALASFALTFARQSPVPFWVYSALDLAFIFALTYTSGGPLSQLRYAFFFVPLGAALLFRPRHTALASAATVVAYLLISLLHPATDDQPGAVELEASQSLYLVWMGFAAVLLARVLTRRTEEVEALAASRGRLVAQALDAEDRERRRLAEALHDDAIQNLLAARQELGAGNGGTADLELVKLGLDRTVEQLRDAVFDLHPYVLEHVGLTAALDAIAEHQARRGGFRWKVEVDPATTGFNDQLLFSIARELVTNAAKHARAGSLGVSVRRRGAEIVLEVADDGVGFDEGRLRAAPGAGHIGLASCAERVEALGGRLEVESEPGRGTRVRAAFPRTAQTRSRGTE